MKEAERIAAEDVYRTGQAKSLAAELAEALERIEVLEKALRVFVAAEDKFRKEPLNPATMNDTELAALREELAHHEETKGL